MGKDHPISWYHVSGEGRGLVHGPRAHQRGLQTPLLRKHLLGGIRYAAGLAPAGAKARQAIRRARTVPSREAYARYAREHPGDPARGRKLFFDPKGAGCVRCHRSRGRGATSGRTSPTSAASTSTAPADRVGARTLAPDRRRLSADSRRHRRRAGPLGDRQGRVGRGADAGRRRGTPAGRRASPRSRSASPATTSLMPDGLAAGLSHRGFRRPDRLPRGLRAAGQGTPGSGVTGPIALPPGFSS